MKPVPTDPMEQYQRHFDALLEDWREAGAMTRVTPRADAVLNIVRKQEALRASGIGRL